MTNDKKSSKVKKDNKELINSLKNSSSEELDKIINYLRASKNQFTPDEIQEIVQILTNKKAEAKKTNLSSAANLYDNGRVIVYTNQTPFETDILRSNLYMMTAIDALAATVLGVGINYTTLVRGFPCVPISPPGLAVLVGSLQTPDIIYSLQPLDATDYGVIPANTNSAYQQFKQGFNYGQQTLATPAPVTSGHSVIHLVEVTFATQDVNNVSRPYYNSIDPASPIFLNNYDTRTDIAGIQLKLGVEGTSPVAPTPDAGYVGLYYITIDFGQTSIVTGNITLAPGAPFISESLTQKVSEADIAGLFVSTVELQEGTLTQAVDVGTPNVVIANPTPAYIMEIHADIYVFMENTNTGASTLNINGLGAYPITQISNIGLVPLNGGEMVAAGWAHFKFNGTNFQLLNPVLDPSVLQVVTSWGGSSSPVAVTSGTGISISGGVITNTAPSTVSPQNIQQSTFTYAVDTGAINAYAVALSPAYAGYVVGNVVQMIAANSNTGNSTLNVNGQGGVSIVFQDTSGLNLLLGGEIIAGNLYQLMFNGTDFVLLNPSIQQRAFIASVSPSSTAALPTSNGLIHFGTINFDPYGWWAGSPSYAFVPTIPGYYSVQLTANVSSSSSDYTFYVYKNTSSYDTLINVFSPGNITIYNNIAYVYLNGVSDAVSIHGFSFGGANFTTGSTFVINYIGS